MDVPQINTAQNAPNVFSAFKLTPVVVAAQPQQITIAAQPQVDELLVKNGTKKKALVGLGIVAALATVGLLIYKAVKTGKVHELPQDVVDGTIADEKIISEIKDGLKKLEKLKEDTADQYVKTVPKKARVDAMASSLTAGSPNAQSYMENLINGCKSNIDRVSNGEAIELIYYNSILQPIESMLTNAAEKIENIPKATKEQFFKDSENLANKFNPPDESSLKTLGKGELESLKDQLFRSISSWEASLKEYSNTAAYLNTYDGGRMEKFYQALKGISFSDYQYKKSSNVVEYRVKLRDLSKKFERILKDFEDTKVKQ